MKVVFPNSAHVTTRERLVIKGGRWKNISLKVRYGVIIHPDAGPVLIDTGYTQETLTVSNRGTMLRLYSRILGPSLNEAEQPRPVLKQFGFEPKDVRYIIVTHFHADHISGLKQFPNARFIVDRPAYKHIQSASKWETIHHGIFPELLPDDFSARLIVLDDLPEITAGYGLSKGRDILGDGRVISTDLNGHAKGHFGVMMHLQSAPLLYAVDVQWLRRALTENRIPNWPSRLILDDFTAYNHAITRVSNYINQGNNVLFCHDPETSVHDFIPQGTP